MLTVVMTSLSEMKISEQHTMTKSETHLIESSNSSIRDNLGHVLK